MREVIMDIYTGEDELELENEKLTKMAYYMATTNANLAGNKEDLRFMLFDDNLDWIGVTDDAPDEFKIAFKNYEESRKIR